MKIRKITLLPGLSSSAAVVRTPNEGCLVNTTTREEHHREISVILYLTDDFEGGETSLSTPVLNLRRMRRLFSLRTGVLFIKAIPLKKVKKRIAVTWIYSTEQ